MFAWFFFCKINLSDFTVIKSPIDPDSFCDITDLSAQKSIYFIFSKKPRIFNVLNAQNVFNRILQQHQCLKGECYYSSKKKWHFYFICLVFEVTQVQRFGQSPKWFSSLTFMQRVLQGPAWVWLSFLTAEQTVLLKHAWKWAYGIIHSNICTHPTLRPLSIFLSKDTG